VLLLIMGNCISLALYDPLQAEDSHHNQTLQHVGAQAVGVTGVTDCTCASACSASPPPVVSHTQPNPHAAPHADLGLNVAFTVEMLLRIISMGGVLHYLSHPWNAFDCLMVLAGYTTFIPMDANSAGLEGVKALRALRALRPLRTITR
jgi:hypothetical protein